MTKDDRVLLGAFLLAMLLVVSVVLFYDYVVIPRVDREKAAHKDTSVVIHE